MTCHLRPAGPPRNWRPPQLPTSSNRPAEDECSSESASRPRPPRRPPAPPEPARPGRARAQPGPDRLACPLPPAACRPRAAAAGRAHAPPSFSTGFLESPAPPGPRSALALAAGSPLRLPASLRTPRRRGRGPRRLPGCHRCEAAARLPLPASVVCRAEGRGRGEEEGGRQRPGGSAPRATGPEAGKVGAVPPPRAGSGLCPRRPAPHAAPQRPATASAAPRT